ncbi:MAG: Ig domain-containing protein [Oscillibacter sp.]|nr:Ig domain-containing protein [Oscillibacter sp.]
MEEEKRHRKKDGSPMITFILVLIILVLSGVLVYLRYGDLMMNRLYQFTDGKIGVETGVTALPGRDANADAHSGADADSDELSGTDSGELPSESDELPDTESGEPYPDDLENLDETEPLNDSPGESAIVFDNTLSDAELTAMYYDAAKALPDGITLSTHDFTLRTLGESATVRVTGGSDGPFTWVSQNPDVAEVDSSGKITARSHGTVNVIVTDGVRKGVCVARMITGATSTEAKLNTTDFTRTVEEGEYQLKVSGVEAPITWTSEDSSVATVDENGLVIPVGKGRTRIRAAWDGGYLICVVRVPE